MIYETLLFQSQKVIPMANRRSRTFLLIRITLGIAVASLSGSAMAERVSAGRSSRDGIHARRRSAAGIDVTLVKNSGAGPKIHLVRRSNRMARRKLRGTDCCPQQFAFDSAAVNGSVPGLPSQGDSAPGKVVEISPALRAVSRANNQFAVDLYRQQREQPGNRFLSPASVLTGLALASAGAAGETRLQIADILHIDPLDSRLTKAIGEFSAVLNATNRNYRLTAANRLWVQSGFPIEETFLQSYRQLSSAEPGPVDFDAPETARQSINEWVASKTGGKIAELLSPGVLDDDTRLILANAIYFKGTWKFRFSNADTRDAPFHVSKDREIQVPMMAQTGALRYADVKVAQVLELPYAGGDLSMIVVLPRELEGLPDLEAKLSADGLESWTSALHHEDEVEVSLPTFSFTSQTGLKRVLSEMGMPLAFTNYADFSGICRTKKRKLSDVIHLALVDVNEEGTEAAAATGTIISNAPGPVPQTVIFRADHPFLFLIQDNRTGAVLFLGRVVTPVGS
jgi:serpin B